MLLKLWREFTKDNSAFRCRFERRCKCLSGVAEFTDEAGKVYALLAAVRTLPSPAALSGKIASPCVLEARE